MVLAMDTKGKGRGRRRVGADVLYTPTAAQVTTFGSSGPFAATIIKVNTDNTVDLLVSFPTVGAAITAAATVAATDLAAFTDPPSAAEMAATRTIANELKADVNTNAAKIDALGTRTSQSRVTGVKQGGLAGQYSFA